MAIDGHAEGAVCPICRNVRLPRELIPGNVLNEAAVIAVCAHAPAWTEEELLCASCLAEALANAGADPDAGDDGPLTPRRPQIAEELLHRRTLGEVVSDAVAGFVGSWSFLGWQTGILAAWIIFNSVLIFGYHFDPYPYILLNLALSWLGALEAPLIMMSQNRQDTRDRLRDENEFRTNLLAEREIRELHEKVNKILEEHWSLLDAIHRKQEQIIERFGE